jgi:hypothetical protein
MHYKVIITKQPPLSKSVFCEIRLESECGGSLSFGNMYFTCDLNNNIIMFPNWLYGEQKILNELKKQGYKL